MTTRIDDGGPAYPVISSPYEEGPGYGHWEGGDKWQFGGMTLRDAFAMRAMAAMVASPGYCVDGWPQDDIAKQSYEMADSMLRARSAGETNAT
ncbi:hypothetical protein [Alcaligenes endophyticus]|uniref:Uncharacterized protein n=1 Tax=Alcaligenes endophyticus TaxID=1929088 RepID=A0ABT8EJ45_9BURK|nr:hypothetical protein [Alcaligenes endophyticus]MCX5592492.1 hypothetical protein [Alcaligenes endophyticus]MDN4121217.1 hypothetical protein [Alcaligenes endophyticus]